MAAAVLPLRLRGFLCRMSAEGMRGQKCIKICGKSASTLQKKKGQIFEIFSEHLIWRSPIARLLRGNLCVQWIKTDKLELGREAACDLAERGWRDNNNNVWLAKWRLLLFSAVTHHLPLFIIVITPGKKCKTGRAARQGKEGEEGVT